MLTRAVCHVDSEGDFFGVGPSTRSNGTSEHAAVLVITDWVRPGFGLVVVPLLSQSLCQSLMKMQLEKDLQFFFF